MLEDRPLIRDLISFAVAHLHVLDIEPELTVSPYVQVDQLDAFDDEFTLNLPTYVRDIYAESDGFEFSWRSDDDWGDFAFPALYELRLHRQRWVNGRMPDERSAAHLDGDFANVLANMRSWLPFDESGGGDLMCLDCSNGRVLEFDHELDGLDERNGLVYANDLREYIQNCARTCFHDVWLARPKKVSRNGDYSIDWASVRVQPKYVVGDSNAT